MRLWPIIFILSACTCVTPPKPTVAKEKEWTLILGKTTKDSQALACSVGGDVIKCEDFAIVLEVLMERQAKEDAEKL